MQAPENNQTLEVVTQRQKKNQWDANGFSQSNRK